MVKRSKKKKVAKKKQLSEKVSNKINNLGNMLALTLKAIDGKSDELDGYFKNQATNIQARIDKLRKEC